ncbi:MAG: hypothetical protein MK132_17150 [Lentisphaerales bacterium]|nr:hypothetical protein [Lentisphaerales bacterium]
MFKTILLVEKDEFLKDFFTRVFFIDGFEVFHINDHEDISKLGNKTINELDMIVYDECQHPKSFSEFLKKSLQDAERTKALPVLGVLSKGTDPEPAHKNFDAVMIKDNFNIQLLTDLVTRLTNS